MEANTWGLNFIKIDVNNDMFIKKLGLNLVTEKKAKETFDKIKNNFVENHGKPDCLIDLIDEDDSIIDDYPVSEGNMKLIALLLGHEIK